MAFRGTMRRRRRRYPKGRIMKAVAQRKNARGPCRSIRVYTTGTSDSKMYLFNANNLYLWNLTQIPRGTQINNRTRDVVNISGIKLRWFFKNTFNTFSQTDFGVATYPIVVNMAILNRKAYSDAMTDEFFRCPGRAERSLAFADASLSGWDRAWLPLNADKFNIIYHRRFSLSVASNSNGYSAGAQNCFKRMARYIKINRQFRYRDESSTSSQDELFLVVWFAAPDDTNPVQIEDVAAVAAETTVYFRNPTT